MNKTILIVEDNVSVLEGFKILLEDYKYKVDTAGSGKAACALVDKFSYDVFIVDMVMPEMNGIELIKKIKEKGKLKTSKVILLTGHPTKDLINTAKELGVDRFLAKPIDNEDLLRELEKIENK